MTLANGLGGSAGYVVASRLSDADPSLSILVIECGPDNRDDSTVVHPIFAFGRMATCGKTMLNYSSIKEPRTAERVINRIESYHGQGSQTPMGMMGLLSHQPSIHCHQAAK
ncbi:hypothetical protein VD0004_g8297 [Verticillium dahliae]|nr:hypothetical protein VD0004_g8297 [Verticillium dahliae]PNH49194.1 hypothetical protein VD0003_g7948 [Verticillium dahliae]